MTIAGDATGSVALLGPWVALLVAISTAIVVVALSVLVLVVPGVHHAALDAAGSTRLLGLPRAETLALSDRSVTELVIGPGTFRFAGPDGSPFYDAAERTHLTEARALFWLLLGIAAAAVTGLGLALHRAHGPRRAALWRAAANGGAATALTTVALGLLAVMAFEPLFELFHRFLFPGGGWAFDPASQRLVQLYPLLFWQVMAGALGLLCTVLGSITWWLALRAAGGGTAHA